MAVASVLPDSITLSANSRHRSLGRLIVAALLLFTFARLARADNSRVVGVIAFHGDAYVAQDGGGKQWAVGTRGLQVKIGFSASGTLSLQRVWNPDNDNGWGISADSEVGVTLNGERVLLQDTGTRVRFLQAVAVETDNGVNLNLIFEHRELHAVITRTYATYPGSPTIEMWTRVDTPGGARPIEVSSMEGWQLTMPASHVRWINGLRGGTSETLNDATFAIQNRDPREGDHIEIGSDRRSTEEFEPILFVDNPQSAFYGGVIWSGAWRMSIDRNAGAFSMRAEFPGSSPLSSPTRPIEFPHSFFGIAAPDADAEATALREFLLQGIRKGRPLQPLVTYNTWFGYGARINQSLVFEEMSRASGLGVELFVVDAGWYQGAGANDTFDFTTGLGSWTVDHDRFPDDLVGMADHAHELGMKFGLWVEPERVALATVGNPGLAREEWLAMQDGSYGDATTAQLCLASDEARQWVFDRIVQLLDRVHPDYLKWDNNFWLNCNRPDHGHSVDEGNYSHVVALYGLLDELRQRYPEMLIENVSGGGSRLDFGMLAYSDVGWMDDGTAPSSHVRHNLEGLTLAFPPAYLLSAVIDNSSEQLRAGVDLAHIARSRMPGILGVGYRYFDLAPEVGAVLAQEIAQYRTLRDTLTQAYAVLLSAQAPVEDWNWDVLLEVSGDRRSAVIFAFKANGDQGSVKVKPRNLLPGTMYQLGSMGAGDMGQWTGAQLMQDGIEIVHYEGSRAHVIIFAPPPLPTEPQP